MSHLDALMRNPIISGSYRQTYPYQVFTVFGYAYISRLFWMSSAKCDPNAQYGEMMNMRAAALLMGAFSLVQALINVGLIGNMWSKKATRYSA
jgi:hypothetical protein